MSAGGDAAAPDIDAKSPEIAEILKGKPSGRAERDGTLFVAMPANGSDVIVDLAYPLNEVQATMAVFHRDIFFASLLSIALATLLAALLAHRVSRRLERILVFANRVAAGDLTARVEEAGLDELTEVTRALDTTAARLEKSFSELQSSRRELAALLDSMQEAVHCGDRTGTGELVQLRVC